MDILKTKDPAVVDALTSDEREKLIRENPVTVMRHIDRRFQALLDYILNGSSRPLGRVIHHFCRAEYQMRGSVHYHCLFWIDDPPNFEDLDNVEALVSFIDHHITVRIPAKDEDSHLHALTNSLQHHACTFTCQRGVGKVCRFHFPHAPSASTLLNQPASKKDSRFYVLQRAADEVRMNPYNPSLLKMWGANMDIQVVRSVT